MAPLKMLTSKEKFDTRRLPMMATRGSMRGAAREKGNVVAVNSGSLRWHYPDRFDGYDLSRSMSGPAPQP